MAYLRPLLRPVFANDKKTLEKVNRLVSPGGYGWWYFYAAEW